MIQKVSDEFLMQAYIQTRALKLDSDFIFLLEEEIKKRKLLFIRDMKDEQAVS